MLQKRFVSLKEEAHLNHGEKSYIIETTAATYIYHKDCGGFASIIDKGGKDWISYNEGAGSSGMYRGIPNLIFTAEGGTFHPGRRGCVSRILCQTEDCITIESFSKHYECKTIWDIYPEYAIMTVAEHSFPYWFLYEGTPGGIFKEHEDFLVFHDGHKISASEEWYGKNVPWVMFVDGNSKRGLYLIRQNGKTKTEDSYWPMEQNMTVWGFGRLRHELPLQSLLDCSPLKFVIGLCDHADTAEAIEYVNSIAELISK